MAATRLLLGTPPPPVLVQDPEPDVEGRSPSVPSGQPRPQPRRVALRWLDGLLPLALVLWITAVRAVKPAAMNDYGLLAALPVLFFVAVGLLLVSVVVALVQPDLSPLRLGLHLVALVAVLHGTIPLIFSQPNFPWVYKHIGVVSYINLHAGLDRSVDIYQNWAGFFAIAAWLTRIAGVASPLEYAAWASVYFNLLTALLLGFVFRSLPVSQRIRWLSIFLFLAGNWVGQDYFAPQAVAFVLSLAVFGMVLAWLQVDRPSAAVRMMRRLASRVSTVRQDGLDQPAPASPAPSRVAALSALFLAFAAIVVTHQLSPYAVILGVGLLTVAGMVRPRWVVVVFIAMAIGYVVLHYPYLERTQDLFGSLADPLHNVKGESTDSEPMTGRRITALAAPALIAGFWTLGAIGVVRRLRCGRRVLVPALLAAAPALIALGQRYGGEALFRIYLFSLPWTAVLAAYALEPRSGWWRRWPAIKVGVVLSGAVALFMSVFFGSQELYVVRPGELKASQHFYEHAQPGSVLTLVAPNFPTRVGGRYHEFTTTGDNPSDLLTTVDEFRHRILGPEDLAAISRFVERDLGRAPGGRYLALSTGQEVYSEVLGLVPRGSLRSLDKALDESPDWDTFYRNREAVIYQLRRAPADEHGGTGDGRAAPARPQRSPDRSVDWAGVATAVLGLIVIGLAAKRRLGVAVEDHEVVGDKEETMNRTSSVNGGEEVGALEQELERWEVGVGAADAEELLRQAVSVAPDARQGFVLALGNLEPEPTRLRELVYSVEPRHRAQALRILGEAWGRAAPAHLRSLLGDVSESVRVAAVALLDDSAEAVGELQQLLRDDLSAEVRVAVIGALARASEQDQLSLLPLILADSDARVRASAIETLPVAGATRALGLVLAAGDDEDPTVRRSAYRRLVTADSWVLWIALERCCRHEEFCTLLREEVPDDELTALVVERSCSPEPAHRILALDLGGRLGTPECVATKVSALQDPEPAVRGAAVDQLGGHLEAVSAVIGTLHDDPDPAVRLAAARTLEGSAADNALLAFIGALRDPDAKVRRVAIDVLIRRSSQGLANRVVTTLTIKNQEVVGEVLLGMGHLGTTALVTALAEGPSELAAAAAQVLRKGGKAKRFLPGLQAVDPTTRLRAVEALGALGGPDAVDGLIGALSDSWPVIRTRAAFHLGQLADPRGRQPVTRVSESDPVPEVVQAAIDALRVMDEQARKVRVPMDRD